MPVTAAHRQPTKCLGSNVLLPNTVALPLHRPPLCALIEVRGRVSAPGRHLQDACRGKAGQAGGLLRASLGGAYGGCFHCVPGDALSRVPCSDVGGPTVDSAWFSWFSFVLTYTLPPVWSGTRPMRLLSECDPQPVPLPVPLSSPHAWCWRGYPVLAGSDTRRSAPRSKRGGGQPLHYAHRGDLS